MPFKSEAQRRWMHTNKPDIIKESTSKADIHRLATKADIPWDNDPKFKRWSKKLTGRSHLDGMSRAQLKRMKSAILDRHREKTAAKTIGHVEYRAKTRSDITSNELDKLRKYLLNKRLRKGETYHYTWPGRGHAIIGDVGKKKAQHVVKTIYKPSDPPPGRKLMVKLPT